jgi:hypothetical protein
MPAISNAGRSSSANRFDTFFRLEHLVSGQAPLAVFHQPSVLYYRMIDQHGITYTKRPELLPDPWRNRLAGIFHDDSAAERLPGIPRRPYRTGALAQYEVADLRRIGQAPERPPRP